MTRQELIQQIHLKKSFLCIGLDSDMQKIPAHLASSDDPQFEFNKQIIDATHDMCVAYKPNTAFYECYGLKGWQSLEKTILYIREKYPQLFIIADAKRGDIGNTSLMYAQAFFEQLHCDAVTVAPYMGEDSVKPFLQHKGKWAILLALTSNSGALDFQVIPTAFDARKVYEKVLIHSQRWGTPENMMYVVGATKAEELKNIRQIIPHHFLLVPGVGAQGGSLEDVAHFGMNEDCGLLVNSSRGIIFADNTSAFAHKAREEASKLQQEMQALLAANK